MRSQWFKNFMGVSRAPFLSLSLVTAVFAWSLAFYQSGFPSFLDGLLILIALMSAHVGVNALNEVQDYESGLDERTNKTLFSGGSGTLIEHPEFSEGAKKIALGAIGLSFFIGAWFVLTVGWELLPVGILGMWLVINYTSKINRHPWLCLISPGLGIGLLATLGSVYILSGTLSLEAIGLVLGFSLLLNNLLLLNQYPDIDPDKQFSRNHLWISKGTVFSLAVYRLQMISAFVLVAVLVAVSELPMMTLLVLGLTPMVYQLTLATRSKAALSDNLVPSLGKNVMICHAFPLLISAILVVSRLLS